MDNVTNNIVISTKDLRSIIALALVAAGVVGYSLGRTAKERNSK